MAKKELLYVTNYGICTPLDRMLFARDESNLLIVVIRICQTLHP